MIIVTIYLESMLASCKILTTIIIQLSGYHINDKNQQRNTDEAP